MEVVKHGVCRMCYDFISEIIHNLNHLARIKIYVWISVAPYILIWHRGMFKYSVGRIWVAPVVIDMLGGRVPGVLYWIEESLGNVAFPVVGVP